MVLIEKNIKEAETMLENLLMKCVEEELNICIHGKVKGFTIRYSSVLDEFFVNHEQLYLVCAWFELNIKDEIMNIDYDEEDGSVHITFSEGELYIDMEEFCDNS